MGLAYVFLLMLYTEHGPRGGNVYVMDSGLTGAECIELMETYNATTPEWAQGNPSCEIDLADCSEGKFGQ